MSTHMFVKMFIALSLVGALAGCEEEPVVGYGDLHVSYRIGSGSQTCEEVGIAFVRIGLLDTAGTSLAEETIVCNPDDQSVIFQDLVEGTYNVSVQGLDDNNSLIFQGDSSSPVDVLPDQTNGPSNVVLDQLRPSIMLWLGFEDVGGCERFGVQDIVVVLYENGASMVFDELYTCSERLEDGLLIDDLSETSTYDIRIRGTNENDEFIYEYNEDSIAVSAGQPSEVNGELTSCSGVCSAP